MSGAAEWAAALGGAARSFTLTLRRLGLTADCRALSSAEVGECLRMGGERGARYALWLSCGALREAGEHLRKRGALLSPFDLTERLPYADALAAAGMILRFSGADAPMIEAQGLPEAGAEAEAEAWRGSVPAAFLQEAAAAPPLPADAAPEAPVPAGETAAAEEQTAAAAPGPATPSPSAARPEAAPAAFPGSGPDADPEALAAALVARLLDAAGNM
jgi:hypothetical protein